MGPPPFDSAPPDPKGTGTEASGVDSRTDAAGAVAEPVMTLRGAGVEVNVRAVGRALFAACLATLAVLVAVLFVAAAHKNDQINRLHRDGVRVEITVTGCLGQLGGSGSNAAGYSCRGSFDLDGRRYVEGIPGNTLYPPGTTLRAVTVPSDPALVATVRAVEGEHASWKVFILPGTLLLVLVLLVTALVLSRAFARREDPSKNP